MKEKIVIGADPSGFQLKEAVKKHLIDRGFDVTDVGTLSMDEPVMYFDVGERLGLAISKGEFERGIVICGTGMGVNLMVNRYPGVYCGLCESVHTVNHARKVNNINVLAMGGWFQGPELGCLMTDAFLDTKWHEDLDEDVCALVTEGYHRLQEAEKEYRTPKDDA